MLEVYTDNTSEEIEMPKRENGTGRKARDARLWPHILGSSLWIARDKLLPSELLRFQEGA